MVIVTILAAIYARYGEIERCGGLWPACPAPRSGFLIAVVFKMMMPLLKKREPVALVILLAVFVAIGLLRLPLLPVLLVAIPLSLGITYFMRRRVAA